MIEISVPGFRTFRFKHLVLDYNGTLAVDGHLLPGLGIILRNLALDVEVHVLTADTFGLATRELADLPVKLLILPAADQADAKLAYVTQLGPENVVAIGNGRNDRKMLHAAALGIAVLQAEGAASETLAAATLIAPGIREALALLRQPKRLIATLRS